MGKPWENGGLPSFKRFHNYRKSPFSMGKTTMHGTLSTAMLVYQRVSVEDHKTSHGIFS